MTDFLQKEDGFYLLKEDGFKLILDRNPDTTTTTTNDILYSIDTTTSIKTKPTLAVYDIKRKVSVIMK